MGSYSTIPLMLVAEGKLYWFERYTYYLRNFCGTIRGQINYRVGISQSFLDELSNVR